MTKKAPSLRIALPAIAALVLTLVLVPGALAGKGSPAGGGKPSGGGTSSLSLVLLDSTDGLPHFGQHVTFNLSTSASQPGVRLDCYQNGTWVSGDWQYFFDNGLGWSQKFTLGPTSLWQGGAADCTAKLQVYDSKRGIMNTLATLNFHVYA